MKFIFTLFIGCFMLASTAQETVKSKPLKLKYTTPSGWTAREFGTKNWDEAGNELCHCAGVHFFKMHKDGKMNVVIYPSTRQGLDSAKRNAVGQLHFEDVIKYDKTRNAHFQFERKKSIFTDRTSRQKSFEVFRFIAKSEDRYYIFYAWQENMQALNSNNEKELNEMINAVEPL